MLPLQRAVVVVMIVLIISATLVLILLSRVGSQMDTFKSASNICESAYASSCRIIGKEPATWEMKTQDVNGTKVTCSKILGCTCTGPRGNYSCSSI
jgi:hypothetical protein